MNDKALYQLERAIDALTQMAKYLREENKENKKRKNISITTEKQPDGYVKYVMQEISSVDVKL
jgi:hypothetical protein